MNTRTLRRTVVTTLLVAVAAVGGACSEQLDGGATCASASPLCPGQAIEIRDTIIDPVIAFDSTYSGFPGLGAEVQLSVVTSPEFESVAVVRFDTLVALFIPPGDTAQAVQYVDSALVKMVVNIARAQVPDSVRIDVFDVGDSTVSDDTAQAPALARLVPRWRIGSKVFAKAALVDSILMPLSDSAILARLKDSTQGQPRLRIAVRAQDASGANAPVVMRFGSVESGDAMQLRYRPKNDTGVRLIAIVPASAGPVTRVDIQRDLMDYTMVTRNTLPELPGTITLGGIPGRRAYLRFDVPRRITDSTTVVRATLRLTQVAYPVGGPSDTVVVHPHIVLAGANVPDNRRASTLIGGAGFVISDSLIVTPNGEGQRTVEMYALVRSWAAQATSSAAPPRAIVLAVTDEGLLPRIVSFRGSTAGSGLRPSMRITYIPKTGFGIP
ncbi:MAG: hypothetical protein P3A28_08350 [Gemmatimonadota bacterium]|nr:hypothetical protein [Gemmatimonadota bacterium]